MIAGQEPTAADTRVEANGARPVGALVTRKGRTLAVEDTVADAQRVLRNPSVEVVPIVDEWRYVGAVTRETIAGAELDDSLGGLAAPLLPTAPVDLSLDQALDLLADGPATRLVIVDPHDGAYRGLVCLTPERDRLCIAAECHVDPSDLLPSTPEGAPS